MLSGKTTFGEKNFKTSIKVDNEKVPLKGFVQQVIGRANLGYITELKAADLGPGDNVAIQIKTPRGTIDDILEEDLGLNERVSIRINDRKISIGEFVMKTFAGINLGMLSALKMRPIEPGEKINISIELEG